MTTFVLVPGMCHGAWCFDDLAADLRSHGHGVVALTLTGVAERAHLMRGGVNLDTKKCIGCQNCIRACPFGAIFWDDSARKPVVCVYCGYCEGFCPYNVIKLQPIIR